MGDSDTNAAYKAQIASRAHRSVNSKVLTYLAEFYAKLDQLGPMAGFWADQIEAASSRGDLQPTGHFEAFTQSDFAELHAILFGVNLRNREATRKDETKRQGER